MDQNKTRAGLIGIAAAYLLYLCYELYQGRGETDTTMTPTARGVFIVLFAISALALLVYAYRVWKHSREQDEKSSDREDSTRLK